MTKRQKILLGILILLLTGFGITWWFLTPKVVGFSPADGQIDVLPSDAIEVVFNHSLQPSDFTTYIKIQPDIPFTARVDGRMLTVSPIESFGEGEEVRITILPGIKSQLGVASTSAATWTYKIKNAWLLYLLDGGGKTDLYRIDPEGLTTDRIMDTAESLIDYGVSPDGRAIIYTAYSGADTTLAWYDVGDQSHTPIYICKNTICSEPILSPDQKYLAFTSGTSPMMGGTGSGKVWLITLNGKTAIGDPIPASGNDHPTRNPDWSSKGWLAIYDDADAEFLFFQPSTGKRESYPSGTGEPGSWDPAGDIYLIPEIQYTEPAQNSGVEYYSRLTGFDLESGEKKDLTQNNQAEDIIPEYSPAGDKIAFARRFLNARDWTPGRQVWVINRDGSNLRKMTNSPDFNHLGFSWSPDNQTLAYLRFNTASLNLQREMWIMDTKTGLSQKVLLNAYRLEWLP